jgi:aspartate aminotransferase-like enzyme
VLLPPSHRAKDVLAALEARGYLAGGGLDPRHGNLIRIGHMGDLEPSHLASLLAQLEEVLQ